MRSLLHHLVNLSGYYEQLRLERSSKNPARAQLGLLRRVIERNAGTLFGQQHDFKNIKSVHDYRSRVPIRDYEGHRPYVDRIIAGDRCALTCDPPFMFNMTSGTTGEPKYVPWNASIDAASKALTRLWIYRCLRDHPRVLNHRVLCIVSAAEEGSVGGLPFGSASGHIYASIPGFVRRHYSLPYSVSEISDYNARYFVSLRISMEHRVSVISTANPGTLVQLAETGTLHAERLIRAIHDGALGVELDDQSTLQGQLERALEPNPARARELERVMRTSGTLKPRDYWPDLSLIGCWTGGSIGSRLSAIQPHYGDLPVRDLGFMASEARMSIPTMDHSPEGVLAASTNFHEFIPETETENPNTLLAHELEIGKRYRIVLTTVGGLYRYDINDLIEVTGFHRRCPLIVFVRKARDMTSITGEKLHVNHCTSVMSSLEAKCGIRFRQFRFAADSANSRYQVFVEPACADQLIDAALVAKIDKALCRQNIEYAQKRNSSRLAAPCLHVMHKGWSDDEVLSAFSARRRAAEFKWRHLLPEPRPQDAHWIEATVYWQKNGHDLHAMNAAPAVSAGSQADTALMPSGTDTICAGATTT